MERKWLLLVSHCPHHSLHSLFSEFLEIWPQFRAHKEHETAPWASGKSQVILISWFIQAMIPLPEKPSSLKVLPWLAWKKRDRREENKAKRHNRPGKKSVKDGNRDGSQELRRENKRNFREIIWLNIFNFWMTKWMEECYDLVMNDFMEHVSSWYKTYKSS